MTSARAELRATEARTEQVFEGRIMGSPLRLTLVGVHPRLASRVWDALLADMTTSELILSRFRDDSELTRLNRSVGAQPVPVDGRLYALLAASDRAQRVTDGRFDPRVVTRLEAIGEHGATLPGVDETAFTETASWLHREPRERRAAIAWPVDSGGLGKGLGLRWALRVARAGAPEARGILIEAGGDLVAWGRGPGGPEAPWLVGIEDPTQGSATPAAVLEIAEGAVATSSTAVRRWMSPDGVMVHHLIDPRTGLPGGDGLLSVTVRHADPAWAEVWSKALFLAGPQAIGPEARARDMAAWWVESDGSLHMTPAARMSTSWTHTEGFI